MCIQYDEQLNDINDIVSSIENICGTSQSSTSYLVRLLRPLFRYSPNLTAEE